MDCHTKIAPLFAPSKINPAGPILAEKFVETNPQTTFAAKIGPAESIWQSKLVPLLNVSLQQSIALYN